MTWSSVHVHHHDAAGIDGLILGAFVPLREQLPPGVDAYFVRHWMRGPHLRIQLRSTVDVRPLVESVIGGYLREHPSAGHPDPDRELPAHRRLAELEREAGDLTPWRPDNSIHFEPYDMRLHVLGSEAAAEQLAQFHVETTPLAIDLLRRAVDGAPRLDPLVTMMLATTHIGCPPITQGYLSYRSHAEGFFANSGDPAGLRARFDAAFEANRDELLARVAAVASDVDDGGTGLLAEWAPIVRRFKALSETLVGTGVITLPNPLPAAAVLEPGSEGGAWSTVSDFHRALYGNGMVREQLTADWFTVYRILLNYQYLLFSRLGVTPVQRFMLCHLVARAAEELNGMRLPTMIGYLRSGADLPTAAAR